MPRVPAVSPATGNPTSPSFIHTTSAQFVDNAGRTLLLRGVNLSGSSKAPVGQPSYKLEGFWQDAENGGAGFVGRPLNLEDGSADVHLARLRGWGFNMLRFPIVWEALEHEGPGKYDEGFMNYVVSVLRKCKEYGFKVYIDPHQDIWSRFSGGSGAPFWTLEACGINPRNMTATQSAILHCEYPLPHAADPASLPAMIWSTNYGRLAAQTIFTLFFAGQDFAPKCIIDDQNIQDYLQTHYIDAFCKLAERIEKEGDLFDECVIGWDSMNEPFEGLVGWENLNVNPSIQGSTLKKGTHPTPAQSLRLGMGQKQTVENWAFGATGPRRDGSVTIDPKGNKIWADPMTEVDGRHPKWGWKRSPEWELGTCIWAQHDVWDVETGFIMTPHYFKALDGEDVEFIDDYWRPHWLDFSQRIRKHHPEAIMFIQPPVFAPPPNLAEEELLGRAAYSAHYYDGLTLITRHWNWFNVDALGLIRGKYKTTLEAVKIGEPTIRKSLQEQLAMLQNDASRIGPYPTIIGEIGIPFDMDDKRSYGWTDGGKYKGDYTRQEKALDASLNAADGENVLNWTVWTYCPDNCHQWGDGWNMEDLSLWSVDDLRRRGGERRNSIYQIDYTSNARLLRSDSNMTESTPCDSMASSSVTIPEAMACSEPKMRGMSMDDWVSNPYAFLTNGARAVRSFCRPWPTKVIGVPKDIKFDVTNAEFRLVVRVRAEDKPRVEESRFVDANSKERQPERLATEIFVPLVHYAHARYVTAGQTLGGDEEDGRSYGEMSGSAGSTRPPSIRDFPSIGLTRITPSSHETLHTLGMLDKAGHPRLPGNILDLSVAVDAGKWEVDGQTLKWWYPVPDEGEPEREYAITIKRRGGPIKTNEARGRWWEWVYDQCCPPGDCPVM